MGYNLEKKKKGTNYWSLVNQGGPITGTHSMLNTHNLAPVICIHLHGGILIMNIIFFSFYTDTKYAVKDVFEGAAYQFRVSAINLSGAGDPSIPCDTVIARDPMSKPVAPNSYFGSTCLL